MNSGWRRIVLYPLVWLVRDTPLTPILLVALCLLALPAVGPTGAPVDGDRRAVAAEPVTHSAALVVGNGTETYTVAGELPDGELHVATWYVDGDYRGASPLDGSSDTASFSPVLEDGPHTVTAYVRDESRDRTDRVRWNVTVVSNRTATPTRDDRALYVWSAAEPIVSDEPARNRFFERVESANVSTVYLSWGASRDATRSDLAVFLRAAHDRGLSVHALVSAGRTETVAGVEGPVERVLAYNDGRPDAARFDGLHLNVEPQGRESLGPFLDEYRALLTDADTSWSANGTTLDSQGLPLSIAVSPWWAEVAPSDTQALLDRESVDSISIMAYSDSMLEVDRRTESVTSLDTDVPYRVAVETDELDNSDVTFYEEGFPAATRALEAVGRPRADDPRFRGATLHAYDPSLTRWDSVRSTDATVTDGEIVVETTVAFDEPTGGEGLALRVTVSAGGRTTTSSVMLDTVDAYTAERLSVAVSSPRRTADSYEVRVSTVDRTRPSDGIVRLDSETTTVTA